MRASSRLLRSAPMAISMMISILSTHARADAEESPDALRAILEAEYSRYRNLELKFEGEVIFPGAIRGESIKGQRRDGVYIRYNGLVRVDAKNRVYYLDEIYDYPVKQVVCQRTTRLQNNVAEDYEREINQTAAAIDSKPADYSHLDFQQSYFLIYPIYSMPRLLLDPPVTVVRAGVETVSGRQCEVYEIHRHKGLRVATGKTLYWKLWLDFERGSIPLRREFYGPDGEVFIRVRDVKLERVGVGEGGDVWVPIEGHADFFPEGGTEPTTTVWTYAIAGSIRVDQDFSDDAFRIKVHPTLAQGEESSPRRPVTDAEIDGRLANYLVDMEKQGNEVKASAYSRTGDPLAPYYWWGGLTSGLGLLAALIIRRRRLLES